MRFRVLCIAALGLLLLAASAQAASYRALVAIDGSQEVPPSGSAATGAANVCIDTDKNTLSYHITHNLGTETASHIHGFAAPGFPAGVKHTLPPGTNKVGTWTYVEGDEASILAGLTYINIHSGAFPGGEIRGQIVPVAGNCSVNPVPASSRWMLVFAALAVLAAGSLVLWRRSRAAA